MKKLILSLAIITTALLSVSCTEQDRARNWGGTTTINLPPGQRLIEATWKDYDGIWYLTEPMDSDYIPQTKVFREITSYSMMQGKVIFVEHR